MARGKTSYLGVSASKMLPFVSSGGSCDWVNRECRVSCGSNWGLWFLLVMLLGAVAYVGGFVAHAHKVKGVPLSRAALPHPEFWLQLKSLVMDGA